MNRRALILILGLTAFFAGFAIARLVSSSGGPPPGDVSASDGTAQTGERASPRRPFRLTASHKSLASAAVEADPVQRRLAILRVLSHAGTEELPELLARHRMDPELAPLIGATWARLDPEAMFAFLRKNEVRNAPGFQPMRVLFENWTRDDPAGALAAIENTELIRMHRRVARGEYVNALLDSDPEEAFAYLASLPVAELPHHPNWRANGWIKDNPAQAVERVVALPDSEFREAALEQIAATWFDLDPVEAATWLATTTAQNEWEPTNALLEKWVEGDPAGAAQYVAENIVGEQRSNSVKLIAASWARSDPQAALDWVTEHIWGGARARALSYIALETTKHDPSAALVLLEQIPNPATRDSARKKVAQEWQRQDSDAALAWAHQIDDLREREDALVAIAHSWSNRAARHAGAHALEKLADDPASIPYAFTEVVARTWVDRFPAESFNWIAKLPPDHAAAAFQLATDEWGKHSRTPVTRKVLHQTLPEQRDLALRALLNTYLKYDGLDKTKAFVEGVESEADRSLLRGYIFEKEHAGTSSSTPP